MTDTASYKLVIIEEYSQSHTWHCMYLKAVLVFCFSTSHDYQQYWKQQEKICQLLNIFLSELFVSLLVWLQSGCYVGDDTFIINSANRRLFWGTQ